MPVVSVTALTRSYGGRPALRGVTLSVEPGELFCISGPDAAGKSTLLRILAGTLKPDSGAVTILGESGLVRSPNLRYSIGYMPQRFAIYADLTAEENLAFYCAFYGLGAGPTRERTDYLLSLTRLDRFRRFLAGNLSGGMKQKLVLACALVHEPELMILDEPTTGIDPLSRREFWAILAGYLARGKTIIYSSVYLEEALRSSRIALMSGGRVTALDTPDNLLARVRDRRFVVITGQREKATAALRQSKAVASVQPLGRGIAFLVQSELGSLAAARQALVAAGLSDPVEPAPATLEDVIITSESCA
jgi:ABC-2 type transport system ATP-binding protein